MYQKILVPLDGSELSECSLEHVKAVASGCRVPETVLLRVVEPLSAETVATLAQAGGNVLREAELDVQNKAGKYLDKIKDRLKKDGLAVKAVVVDGRPAEEILDYAQKNKIDLIVMASHGRSGVSRWFFGSVAQKVMQHSSVPVLMVSPPSCRTGN
jgi:nucleotide-binding universal stress UspA family protein